MTDSSQESIILRRLLHIFVFWEENRCLIIYINYAKSKAFTVTRHLATDMNEEGNWLMVSLTTAVPAQIAMALNLSAFSLLTLLFILTFQAEALPQMVSKAHSRHGNCLIKYLISRLSIWGA